MLFCVSMFYSHYHYYRFVTSQFFKPKEVEYIELNKQLLEPEKPTKKKNRRKEKACSLNSTRFILYVKRIYLTMLSKHDSITIKNVCYSKNGDYHE